MSLAVSLGPVVVLFPARFQGDPAWSELQAERRAERRAELQAELQRCLHIWLQIPYRGDFRLRCPSGTKVYAA